MDIDREELSLEQLADAAGLNSRTVRYYIQQKLLPSPGTRGPGTRYDRALLDRLLLIKRLQRHNLPLSEIRRRLEALDDEGVRQALAAPSELDVDDNALGYVRGVMAMTRLGREEPPVRAARLAAPARSEGTPNLVGETPSPYLPRAVWERVTLSPDVELHVRRELPPRQRKLVDRLLDAARRIFSEEP